MNTLSEPIDWKDYLKRNRALLVVGLLLFFFGVWIDIQWIPSKPSGILYLINLLPGTSLLFSWLLASKIQQNRWGIIIVGSLISLVITLFVTYMNIGAAAFVAAITPETEIAHYEEISTQFGESELTQHFPLSIPENAKNVKYESLPKFLQGGGHIQLRMTLPKSEIGNLLHEFRSKAQYSFIGGDRSDHSNITGGVPTTYFYTSDNEDRSFPDDYEILVLDAQPGGTPDFQWNHGSSYGVVISLEKSEIIYWVEYW